MLELLIGQIPEAIYFSLFFIYSKNIKEKKVLFVILMLVQYLFFVNVFARAIYFYIGAFITPSIITKILYKRFMITDVFLMNLASLISLLVAIPLIIINFGTDNIYILTIINKLILFLVLILNKKKLEKFYKLYCENWNRNYKTKNVIKSLTLRNWSIFLFSLLLIIANAFFVINR